MRPKSKGQNLATALTLGVLSLVWTAQGEPTAGAIYFALVMWWLWP